MTPWAFPYFVDLTPSPRAISILLDIGLEMPIFGGLMQEYETLKQLVVEAQEDVEKATGGNKAAGTRVRKKMQEIKSAAQEVRKKILEGREGEPGTAGAEASEAD